MAEPHAPNNDLGGRLLPFRTRIDELDFLNEGRTDLGTVRFDVPGADSQIRVGIRRETVEVWYRSRCYGTFDRVTFRDWLSRPRDWLEGNDVLWVGSPTYVAVGIAGVLAVGAIKPSTLETLVAGV